MVHRLSLLLAGLTASTVAVGCKSDDPPPSTCSFVSTRLDGSPLTLLSDARLDRVGAGFVLLGSDAANVRWATLGLDGHLGAEHAVAVPAHTDGPWFAMAGTAATPGDHLIVAYAAAGASGGGTADLMTFSVAADGTSPSIPASSGPIPDRAANPLLTVSAVSGRGGAQAGLVWAVQGTTAITARLLGPDGAPLGADLNLGMPASLSCIRFSPGQQDLTVLYVDVSGATPKAVGREISATGTAGSSFTMPLIGDNTVEISCASLALLPTGTGYSVAWKSTSLGDYFGTFDQGTGLFSTYLLQSDVQVSSGAGAAPIAGLGAVGKDFTLVVAPSTGGQLWETDFMGRRLGAPLLFPTTAENVGAIATQPLPSTIYATYADYSSTDVTDQTAGGRVFLALTCL